MIRAGPVPVRIHPIIHPHTHTASCPPLSPAQKILENATASAPPPRTYCGKSAHMPICPYMPGLASGKPRRTDESSTNPARIHYTPPRVKDRDSNFFILLGTLRLVSVIRFHHSCCFFYFVALLLACLLAGCLLHHRMPLIIASTTRKWNPVRSCPR